MAQKVTGPRRWIPMALILVGGGVFLAPQVGRLVSSAQQDGGSFLPSMTIGLVITAACLAAITLWFVLRFRERRDRVADAHPGARLVHFTPTAELAAAARAFGARISTSSHGTMVVHHGRFKLFTGGAQAPRIDLPVDAILDISVGESLVGARWSRSIEVTVAGPDGPVSLAIAPLHERNVFRTVSEGEIEAMAERLRQEVAAHA